MNRKTHTPNKAQETDVDIITQPLFLDNIRSVKLSWPMGRLGMQLTGH